MSWNSKVIWSEGMFLQPQHFQQQDRYIEWLLENRTRALFVHGYGFSHLELDGAALGLGKVQISSARGVLPDGTPFDIPNTHPAPEAIEIDPEAKDELIALALPLRRTGAGDVHFQDEGEASLARYNAEELDAIDTATPNPRSALLQIGELRLRLMRARDAADAYAYMGVAHVQERQADNSLLLRNDYIPPVLTTRATPVLNSLVRDLQGRLHQLGESLAETLAQPGRGGVAEIAEFLQLQTVNRFEPLFDHLVQSTQLHPEDLFKVCLQLAGDLAIFNPGTRRPRGAPEYRHDALRESYAPLATELRNLLSLRTERSAVPIDLQERKFGVRVAVIADTQLLKTANFVLAVNAQMQADMLRARFPAQVKIGPAEKIRDLVNLQLPGITLVSLAVAPRQIPYHAGFAYFQLERSGELWKQLEQSGSLAMHVAGDFPGLEMEFWAVKA